MSSMQRENCEMSAALDTTLEVTLEVKGMRCDNCARSLTDTLSALEGVAEPRVSFALEEAQLAYDLSKTTLPLSLRRTSPKELNSPVVSAICVKVNGVPKGEGSAR